MSITNDGNELDLLLTITKLPRRQWASYLEQCFRKKTELSDMHAQHGMLYILNDTDYLKFSSTEKSLISALLTSFNGVAYVSDLIDLLCRQHHLNSPNTIYKTMSSLEKKDWLLCASYGHKVVAINIKKLGK